jgi:hypothetical protein
MTIDNEMYERGFSHAKRWSFPSRYYKGNEDYMAGWNDGKDAGGNRPVDDEYVVMADPPHGYEWTGEKRVPEPGDYYLSKGGNATLAKKVRKNNQTRHILRRSK